MTKNLAVLAAAALLPMTALVMKNTNARIANCVAVSMSDASTGEGAYFVAERVRMAVTSLIANSRTPGILDRKPRFFTA